MDEATMSQMELIHRLLEGRRVSSGVASEIISKLLDLPELGVSGGSNRDILRTVRERIERDENQERE